MPIRSYMQITDPKGWIYCLREMRGAQYKAIRRTGEVQLFDSIDDAIRWLREPGEAKETEGEPAP